MRDSRGLTVSLHQVMMRKEAVETGSERSARDTEEEAEDTQKEE